MDFEYTKIIILALREKWEVLQSKGVSCAATAEKVWLVLIIYT